MDGQLAGVNVYLDNHGWNDVQVEVSIGLGDAWSTDIVFTKEVWIDVDEGWFFFDTLPSDIHLMEGDTFVIQVTGIFKTSRVGASYIAPPDPQPTTSRSIKMGLRMRRTATASRLRHT